MPKTLPKPSVDFEPLPKLPLQLEDNPDLVMLHSKINSIVAQVKATKARKTKLRVITQNAAIHYACLKLALNITKGEGMKISPHAELWNRALLAVASRAQEVCLLLCALRSHASADRDSSWVAKTFANTLAIGRSPQSFDSSSTRGTYTWIS